MELAAHPLLREFELPEWCSWPQPPSLNRLQADLGPSSPLLLVDAPEDGLHYEQRITERGQIATRPGSWHDAWNAWMWSCWPQLKSALNRRQADDVLAFGPKQRSRAQMAITHFDESGLVVVARESALVEAWSRHDWTELFLTHRAAWSDGRIRVYPVGHALLEHLQLMPHLLLTAKAVAVLQLGENAVERRRLDTLLAERMDARALLEDPQHPRPLPVSGIPGAWPQQDADFYRTGECFRPVREGRIYQPPIEAS